MQAEGRGGYFVTDSYSKRCFVVPNNTIKMAIMMMMMMTAKMMLVKKFF